MWNGSKKTAQSILSKNINMHFALCTPTDTMSTQLTRNIPNKLSVHLALLPTTDTHPTTGVSTPYVAPDYLLRWKKVLGTQIMECVSVAGKSAKCTDNLLGIFLVNWVRRHTAQV